MSAIPKLRLSLISALCLWEPPRSIRHSLTTSFDGLSVAVSLWAPGRGSPPAVAQILWTASEGEALRVLDDLADAYLGADPDAVPARSRFGERLDAAAEVFEAGVAAAAPRRRGREEGS